ncbi:hypothetical protein [Caulobacter sp. UC70_42]|uniref:hypothetical protein n=1 Tax=Caulobacter sp. UC70_42 TaxID=3374551 RepID=UPI00375795BC
MPGLLEQLLTQLQDFPDPPDHYRPQMNEPPLASELPFRLVTGFSGAGKTAWASQAALHSPASLVYFDVTDMASGSMAANLAREIAARFLGGRSAGASAGLFAQSSGLERTTSERPQTRRRRHRGFGRTR